MAEDAAPSKWVIQSPGTISLETTEYRVIYHEASTSVGSLPFWSYRGGIRLGQHSTLGHAKNEAERNWREMREMGLEP